MNHVHVVSLFVSNKAHSLRFFYLPVDKILNFQTLLSNDCKFKDCGGTDLTLHITCDGCDVCEQKMGNLGDGEKLSEPIAMSCPLKSIDNMKVHNITCFKVCA